MNRLRQQLITKRIISELPYLLQQDIDEIQREINSTKKVRTSRTKCKPAKDHDQIVKEINKPTRRF